MLSALLSLADMTAGSRIASRDFVHQPTRTLTTLIAVSVRNTCSSMFRKPLLYPAELRDRIDFIG